MTISVAASALPEFDSFWNFGKPAETEVKFRELLPPVEKSGNLDHALQLWTQIARALGLQRKFAEAHTVLASVRARLTSATTVSEIRYFLESGRIFNSSMEKEKALPLFTKAYELAVQRKQENLAVDAAHMVAIAETLPGKQTEWNLRAMKVAEKSSDPKARKWLGSLYNNMGWTYHDSGNYEEALKQFEKALDFRIKQGDPENIRVAKWCIGRVYRSLKRYDDALKVQQALEKELEKPGMEDGGYVFEELGELHLIIEAPASASGKYFNKAYEILSKDEWFRTNEAKRLARMKELAGIH